MADNDGVARERIIAVLKTADCAEGLRSLLVQLKGEGLPRTRMLKMLMALESRHRNDEDETIYDAILFGIDVVFSSTHPRRIY
jgi:allophanate hydrolase subunit 1